MNKLEKSWTLAKAKLEKKEHERKELTHKVGVCYLSERKRNMFYFTAN